MVNGIGRACGKLILLGEHFVVHGGPALAVPLRGVEVTIRVRREDRDDGPLLASDVTGADERRAREVLQRALGLLALDEATTGGMVVEVASTIPPGYGLGSSSAFSVALIAALAAAAGRTVEPAEQQRLAHELERVFHGTPSGLDDTVVTSRLPVWFRRGAAPSFITPARALNLVLASSGTPGATGEAVASVRQLKDARPQLFARLQAEAAADAEAGLRSFSDGAGERLGPLLSANHRLLQQLGVATATLDRLVDAACAAGAWGAKLTGAGFGGFVVAVVAPELREPVVEALQEAGSPLVLHETVAR